MRIRRFALTDLPGVMRVERASFGAAGHSSTTFLGHALRDRKHSFVAEDEQGTVVGYTLVRMNLGWLSARRGGITSIAVDPRQRRRGTGGALMARALEYLAEEGVDEADLEVEVNNVAAQSLYEAFGFRRSHLLPNYYGPNCDGMRMVVDVGRANQTRTRDAARAKRAADGRGVRAARRD